MRWRIRLLWIRIVFVAAKIRVVRCLVFPPIFLAIFFMVERWLEYECKNELTNNWNSMVAAVRPLVRNMYVIVEFHWSIYVRVPALSEIWWIFIQWNCRAKMHEKAIASLQQTIMIQIIIVQCGLYGQHTAMIVSNVNLRHRRLLTFVHIECYKNTNKSNMIKSTFVTPEYFWIESHSSSTCDWVPIKLYIMQ